MDWQKNKSFHKEKFWFWGGLVLVFLTLLPGFVLGENAIFTYHDQLDGEVIVYLLQAKHLFSGSTLPEFMNGASKTALTMPAPACVLLFLGGNALFGLNAMLLMGKLFGYLGMYFLAKRVTGRDEAAAVSAVLFAWLPFLPVYGLSQFGIPLLVWCALCLQEGKKRWLCYGYILFFALNSSLVLSGFGVLGLGICWLLFLLIRKKENFCRAFCGWLLLFFTYLVENWRLLAGILGIGENFTSHKEEYVLTANSFWSLLKQYLLKGGQHSEDYHLLPVLTVLLVVVIGEILKRRTGKKIATVRKEVRVNAGTGREATEGPEAGNAGTENEETGKAETVNAGAEGEESETGDTGTENEETGKAETVKAGAEGEELKAGDEGKENAGTENTERRNTLKKVLIICVAGNLCLAVAAALWGSTPGIWLRGRLSVLGAFQLDRVLWMAPCFWYLAVACGIALMQERIKGDKKNILLGIPGVVLGAALLLTGVHILLESDVKSNVQKLRNPEYGILSFREYYAIGVLEQVDTFLQETTGKTKEEYRVVSLGIDPAAALYHGFFCLDGYSNNYSVEYKHAFRKILEPELAKSEYLTGYFDDWGNRCYLFSSECPGYYTIEKNGFYFQNYEISAKALKELGGDYLLSAAYIANGAEQGLKLLREAPFETADSYYGIYVYEVCGE